MPNDQKRILIRQTNEWGEILLGFESRNRYELFDEDGRSIGRAAEQGQGFGRMIVRTFLGRCRQSTIHLFDAKGEQVGRGEKPFRFYFHRMDVYEHGVRVGAIQRKFSILHRKFVVEDAQGRELLEIHSPFFRIWTFKVLFQGREVGRVSKRWGGLLREMFTDADTFGIEYSDGPEMEALRTTLICATFLIDFTCFENNNRGGSSSN
ncbi:MAG: hypothetical protein ACI8QZ_003414 [Chlamydiales bacterium]|jgi:uncharacterized protein YxjI